MKIRDMYEGGVKLGSILQKLLTKAAPGITLFELEALANKLIHEAGAEASFKTVRGYEWATCLCVNEVVVHGVPTDYALRDGDLLTIDVGLLYKGFHTDTAWTIIVQNSKVKNQNYEEKKKFLKTGEEALWKAIGKARAGNRIGHISKAIQENIEGAGYSVVKTLVGHGVGRQLHEPPQIPGFLKGSTEATPELTEGLTIAIEVIYTMGKGDVYYVNDDGWSIATRDGSLSAVFEQTIAITQGEPLVLTRVGK